MSDIDDLATTPFVGKTAIPAHVPPHLVRDLRWASGAIANELDDPYSQTVRLLEDDIPPVLWTTDSVAGNFGGGWVVTRYEDIAKVYQDADAFSTRKVAGYQYFAGETWPVVPLAIDPPDHMKYRMLLNPYFSPKAIDGLEPSMRAIANELIDSFIDDKGVDFAHEFGRVFPVRVFLNLMGLPFSMFEKFLVWEFEILHSNEIDRISKSAKEILAYLREFIEETRQNPSDNLTSKIIRGQIDGRNLTSDEEIGTLFLLWLGGLDTVAATLALMFRRLSLNPDMLKALVDDRDLIPNAVEEFLRVQPLVMSGRMLKKDMVIHDVAMKEGDWIMCLTSVGNFDPAEFKCPREVQFDRQPNRHFTLAGGPHRCLGSHLARRELRVALEEWLRRIPSFQLKPEADRSVFPGLIGARHLPLVW